MQAVRKEGTAESVARLFVTFDVGEGNVGET